MKLKTIFGYTTDIFLIKMLLGVVNEQLKNILNVKNLLEFSIKNNVFYLCSVIRVGYTVFLITAFDT